MNIRNFDLNLLLVFNDLSKTESVTRTSLNLGLSQPAISHALNRLREGLGDELFTRTKRKLVPTEYALKLRGPVQDILASLEDTIFNKPEWDAKTSAKSFVLSGTSYDASILFPQAISLLETEAPKIKFKFKGISVDKYLERMANGEVDLSFSGNLKQRPYFKVQTLGEWDFCLVVSSHNKRFKRKVDLGQYLEAKHILYSPTELEGSPVDSILAERGLTRNVCIETPYLESIPRIITRGDYIALLPVFYAKAVKSCYPIKLLEPPFHVKPFKHQMVWHSNKEKSPDHIWLRNFIETNYFRMMK